MTYGLDWTHTPNKSDLEDDMARLERYRYWKKFQYTRIAKRFGTIVHTETVTVYARTEYIFQTIINHWNTIGNKPRPLNPGLTWHYAAA